MAKRKIQVRLRTKMDNGVHYTEVKCSKGIIGAIYYLEDDESLWKYAIQNKDGYWYRTTYETELEAVRYLVQNSFLMNWDYDIISIKLSDYCNSEDGAITEDVDNINLAA